jgi:pyruvate dehydrogenase E1 component beta subunit
MGIGASMLGIRPVMELMFWSFHSVAFDQLVNNAACCRYMSGGLINVPIVMRGPANGGTNVGATHSHTPEGLFAAFPGLKVCSPATPADAKGMMKTAIRDNDPVYVMENTTLYGNTGEVPDPADGDFLIPLGKADIKREGSDISLIAHGASVLRCLEAADILANEHNIDAEVVDLRSIRPLDQNTIIESVKKTNRAVLVDESKPFCGVSAQITTLIQEHAFDYLDAPDQAGLHHRCAPAIYSKPHVEHDQLPKCQTNCRASSDHRLILGLMDDEIFDRVKKDLKRDEAYLRNHEHRFRVSAESVRSVSSETPRLLDIGCWPGYLSLYFRRSGWGGYRN